MTTFKVGDIVTPKSQEEFNRVLSQLNNRHRDMPSPPFFKVVDVSDDGEVILYYDCGYHSYASRMMLAPPPDKSLEDYM